MAAGRKGGSAVGLEEDEGEEEEAGPPRRLPADQDPRLASGNDHLLDIVKGMEDSSLGVLRKRSVTQQIVRGLGAKEKVLS